MIEKMTSALKKRYSNLGLTDEMFSKVAPMAVLGMAADADEAAIEARASESYISDMLKTMQSQADKIRTLEAQAGKKNPKDNKGGDEPKDEPKGEMKEILALLREQKESNNALQARLDALETAGKTKSFEEKVAIVAKELNVSGSILDLLKSGLSSDMDETAIRDTMGAKKKILVDAGVVFSDAQQMQTEQAQTEAEKKEASDWVKQHEIK